MNLSKCLTIYRIQTCCSHITIKKEKKDDSYQEIESLLIGQPLYKKTTNYFKGQTSVIHQLPERGHSPVK